MDTVVKIYTDGGARGNPGPAAAAFVVVSDGRVVFKDAQFLGTTTNNVAEYKAVILALNWLLKNKKLTRERRVLFYLDSELVVLQLTRVYKIKNQNLKLLANLVQNISSKIGQRIFYKQIKREKNKLADKLVNYKIDENT